MILSSKIWEELGPLAARVDLVNHDTGEVRYRGDPSAEDRAAIQAVIAAHNPSSPDAATLAKQKDAQDAQDAKADAKFQEIVGFNPAQAKQWAKDTFPTLTLPEQKALGLIVSAVALLGRRL